MICSILYNTLEIKLNRLAGVAPVETLNNVNMQKNQIILSEQQRMKNIYQIL